MADGTSAVTICRLSVDDAEVYRAFRLHALRTAPTAFTSTFDEEDAKPLSATTQRLTGSVVLGAYDDAGTLVGAAGLARSARVQERHKATLFGMAVAPHATGQGIGRALVLAVLDLATQIGVQQVNLTVSEGNVAAERLYRSCGFTVWGREPRAIIVAGRPIVKLHMVRPLDASDP